VNTLVKIDRDRIAEAAKKIADALARTVLADTKDRAGIDRTQPIDNMTASQFRKLLKATAANSVVQGRPALGEMLLECERRIGWRRPWR
jgi:hypothetical protein